MGSPNQTPANLHTLFEKHFSKTPRWLSTAPGRINIIGEHTDYNSGLAMPMAIDKHVYIVASESDSNRSISTLASTNFAREVHLDFSANIEPLPLDHPDAFINYILGVAKEFQEIGCEIPPLNLVIHSDIPIGAGLASSAAVEVAFAKLLQQITQREHSNLELAKLCQRAEHKFAGTPCGVMDQWASLEGSSGGALLMDFESERCQTLLLPPSDQLCWIVFDTGVKHRLADGEYADRRMTCEAVADKLGLSSLRLATPAMLQKAAAQAVIDDTQHRRATHVVLENVRVLLAATALVNQDHSTWSEQMFASHDSLRDLFEVSCDESDAIVHAVRVYSDQQPSHTVAARMTGGGFGGSVIAGCSPALKDELINIVNTVFSKRFGRAATVFEVQSSAGARVELLKTD